jgi:hypothetical protein
MDATQARDAALTVPTAAMSASFDLSNMVFLPLIERSGAGCLVVRSLPDISSGSGIFNRGVFEWTVHDGEMVEHDVPADIGADCSLGPHRLFQIRSLIERHRRSHLETPGRGSWKLRSAWPENGPITIKGRCEMKSFASANKYLSAAFALVAIAASGTMPAFAQSRDHTGSMMPSYYDETGAQKAGSWSRQEEAATANQQAAQPSQSLYLYAGKRSPRHGAPAH